MNRLLTSSRSGRADDLSRTGGALASFEASEAVPSERRSYETGD
jgi:hypothetical protein